MMIRKSLSLCSIALVALALGAGAGRALAADIPQERVTVQGPYTIRHMVIPDRVGRQQTDQVSITQSVSYADLNLSRETDVALLKDRVSRAARDNCNKLKRSFPAYSFGTTRQRCIADAVAPINARVDQIAMLRR